MVASLTPKEYRSLFNQIAASSTLEDIEAIKIKGRDRTTSHRARSVARDLMNRGLTHLNDLEATQIAKHTGYRTTIRFVNNAFYEYLAWRATEGKKREEELGRHLSQLKVLLNQLSSCVKDIQPHRLNAIGGRNLLGVDGQDWRLDPLMWFYLCIPDFKPNYKWGVYFPYLKSHMHGSPFWKHYGDLWKKANQLDIFYAATVGLLGPDFDSLRDKWVILEQEKLKRQAEISPYPSVYPSASPDELYGFEPVYDSDFADVVVKKLSASGFEPVTQMVEMEELIVQMRDEDLMTETTWPLLESNSCEECKKWATFR